jgi:hypothetical protein
MVRIRRRHGIQLRSCWVPAFSGTTQRSAGYLAEPEGVFPRLFRKSLVSFVRPFLALELVAGDVVATLVAPTPARRPVTALKMPTTAATINKTAPIPPTATTSGSGALCRGFSNAVDGCSALRPPLASSPESWPGGIVRPGTQPASTNSTRLPRPLNTPYTDNAGRNAEPAVPMLAMKKKMTIGITSMVPSRNRTNPDRPSYIAKSTHQCHGQHDDKGGVHASQGSLHIVDRRDREQPMHAHDWNGPQPESTPINPVQRFEHVCPLCPCAPSITN